MSERKMVTLATRKQMDIYMNPQRQRLLKALEVSGKPMTPKQLSNVLKISALPSRSISGSWRNWAC